MSSARGDKICGDVEQPATDGENSDRKAKKSNQKAKKSSSCLSDKKRKLSSSAPDLEGESSSEPLLPEVKSKAFTLPSGKVLMIYSPDPDEDWEELKESAEEGYWEKMEERFEEDAHENGLLRRKDCPDWEAYKKQLHDNRGFELTIYPGRCRGATYKAWDFRVDGHLVTFQDFLAMCQESITSYNNTGREEEYRFMSENDDAIEHVTRNFETHHDRFYITFKACQVRNPSIVRSFRAKYLFIPHPGCKQRERKLLFCIRKDDAIWEQQKKDCRGLPCCPFRIRPNKLFLP